MQACFVQESVLRNSTSKKLPRRTSFDSFSSSSASSIAKSSVSDKPQKNELYVLIPIASPIPKSTNILLPREDQPQSSSEIPSTPARSYFRPPPSTDPGIRSQQKVFEVLPNNQHIVFCLFFLVVVRVDGIRKAEATSHPSLGPQSS